MFAQQKSGHNNDSNIVGWSKGTVSEIEKGEKGSKTTLITKQPISLPWEHFRNLAMNKMIKCVHFLIIFYEMHLKLDFCLYFGW